MADYADRETRWSPLKVALALYAFIFLLLLYGPTIVMTILSFQGPNAGPTFPIHQPSVAWYARLFNPDVVIQSTGEYMGRLGPPAWRSLALALMTAAISTTFATMAAQAFRTRFSGSSLVFNIYLLGIVIPGIALGLGHALFWQYLGVDKNWYSTALLVHVIWTFPFCFLILLAVFNRFDRSIEQAAMCLGAPPWRTFWRITLPLIKPGVMASVLFAFTLSFDEFPRTFLVNGAENTLPLEVLGATTVRVTPRLYAMGTVITAISLVVVVVMVYFLTTEIRRMRYSGQEEHTAA
jgi:putative spermidine/putrescine transport system permease protein